MSTEERYRRASILGGHQNENPNSPLSMGKVTAKYSTMTTFAYDRALQGRSVRLLKVIPDCFSNILAIELTEQNLDEAKFEALSYVWGDTAERKTIECNGRSFDIGTNLHAALQERRYRKSLMYLWADQICINQSDNEEKTHQVRMMRDIYAKADQVIVWLGREQHQDMGGFDLANTLYDKCNGKQYDPDEGIYDFHDFEFKSNAVLKPLFDPTWTALFKILGNQWFGRVWVIQEILVAERSEIWKGSLKMDTEVILWLAMLVGRHRNIYERFDITMGSPRESALMARNIAASYFEFKKKGPLPLYDMLSRHSGMGATDPRDRFFALTGVSSGLNKAFVDYKKTFQEVACLVGKLTLLGFPDYEIAADGVEVVVLKHHPKEHKFLVEWLAFHANPQNHKLNLPSWVPDLLSPHSPGLLLTGFYNTLYLREWRDVPKPQVRMEEQLHNTWERTQKHWKVALPKEIEIKGAVFDYVRDVARDRPPLPSSTIDNPPTVWKSMKEVSKYEAAMVYWLSELRLLAEPALDFKASIMDGLSFDAFWRTLIYNRGPRFDHCYPNQRAEDSLGISFGYWYLRKKLRMAWCQKDDLLAWFINDRLLKKLSAPFEEAEGRVGYARNFFVSRLGRIGWVPFRTRAGDQVCVMHGVRIPLILRAREDRWEVIGACYIHGLMDGELWDLDGLRWMYMNFV